MEKRAIENLGLEGVVCVNMVYEVVLVRDGWVQGIGGIFCLNLYLGLLVAETHGQKTHLSLFRCGLVLAMPKSSL